MKKRSRGMRRCTMRRAGVPAGASNASRRMNGFLFLAALAPLFVPATPTPTPVLPQIGRVRSNALCTTLRQNIAPTIAGLMKNDELIGAGHRAFAKMAHDQGGSSSAAIDIDKLYLEQVETRLVHNLGVIDRILGDQIRFPVRPKNADEQDALTMRSQLLAVADSQRKALDLVSGTLETENLGQMQHEMSDQMKSAVGQPGPQADPTGDPTSFIGAAGLPEYSPVAGLPTTASKQSSLVGHTVYDSIAEALEGTQNTTARREQVATSTVIAAVGECRASAAPASSPSPAASPTP
jgi:hypothetical protein